MLRPIGRPCYDLFVRGSSTHDPSLQCMTLHMRVTPHSSKQHNTEPASSVTALCQANMPRPTHMLRNFVNKQTKSLLPLFPRRDTSILTRVRHTRRAESSKRGGHKQHAERTQRHHFCVCIQPRDRPNDRQLPTFHERQRKLRVELMVPRPHVLQQPPNGRWNGVAVQVLLQRCRAGPLSQRLDHCRQHDLWSEGVRE